jgi:hypothetical protein
MLDFDQQMSHMIVYFLTSSLSQLLLFHRWNYGLLPDLIGSDLVMLLLLLPVPIATSDCGTTFYQHLADKQDSCMVIHKQWNVPSSSNKFRKRRGHIVVI